MSVQDKIENAVRCIEAMANSSEHGYDQSARWGPDYDCSSAVIHAWEFADVPVKRSGASYTGNMYSVFTRVGFQDVTAQIELESGSGLQRGDVLLNHVKHTAMYIGGGKTAEANINEFGTVSGGQRGDQTGREFWTREYRNYPWDCVLRYTGAENSDSGSDSPAGKGPSYYYSNFRIPLIKKGMESPYVRSLQEMLGARDYYSGEPDGIYGPIMEKAVLEFQSDKALETDGEVGRATWTKLLGG